MDVALVIRHRLKELGLEQKDLAAAAQVTESYISQLLARKKAPPAPGRTDLYDRLSRFLKLPEGELARLAELERQQELRKRAGSPLQPLFKDFRELTLRKCDGAQQTRIREIFEKEPFGALERLVTQKLLDVAKRVAREELENESWLRLVARLSDRSYEEMRVMVLEFLDTDIVDVSLENCVSFLDPLIEAWDIDMTTFGMEIVLNRRLTPDRLKRFEFVEKDVEAPSVIEPGFEDFLRDASLSADATEEEIEFLKRLRFTERRPVALYYYRELQNLRDPLHFRTGSTGPGGAAGSSD